MRSRHDQTRRAELTRASLGLMARLAAQALTRRRRRGGDAEGEPCPVEPNRPLDLSGGAAAALEFDR